MKANLFYVLKLPFWRGNVGSDIIYWQHIIYWEFFGYSDKYSYLLTQRHVGTVTILYMAYSLVCMVPLSLSRARAARSTEKASVPT